MEKNKPVDPNGKKNFGSPPLTHCVLKLATFDSFQAQTSDLPRLTPLEQGPPGYLVTNLVTNLSPNLVTNWVITKFVTKFGDDFGDQFSDKFSDHQIW